MKVEYGKLLLLLTGALIGGAMVVVFFGRQQTILENQYEAKFATFLDEEEVKPEPECCHYDIIAEYEQVYSKLTPYHIDTLVQIYSYRIGCGERDYEIMEKSVYENRYGKAK